MEGLQRTTQETGSDVDGHGQAVVLPPSDTREAAVIEEREDVARPPVVEERVEDVNSAANLPPVKEDGIEMGEVLIALASQSPTVQTSQGGASRSVNTGIQSKKVNPAPSTVVHERGKSLLTVIEFEPSGLHTQVALTRSEVLEFARATLNDMPQHTKSGDASPRVGASRGKYQQGPRYLHSRDLRLLNPELGHGDPSIIARVDATIVHLPPIRAVVMHSKCLVFLNEGADQELEVLLDRFEAACPAQEQTINNLMDSDSNDMSLLNEQTSPFEIRVLEAILESVFTELNRAVSTLQKRLPTILERVVATPSPKDLNQLRKAKNDYDVLFSKATSLKQVLKTLLDVDEDLALMQLTELHQRGENALENLLSVNVEDIELLLEAYLEVAHGICRRLEVLDRKIDNTEEVVEIQLDTTRNRLLTLGFVLNVITCVMTFCAMLAGIFGMNLSSGIEDSEVAFGWTVGFIGAALIGLPLLVLYAFHSYAKINLWM